MRELRQLIQSRATALRETITADEAIRQRKWFMQGVVDVIEAIRPGNPNFIADVVTLYLDPKACETWDDWHEEAAGMILEGILIGLKVCTPEHYAWLGRFNDEEEGRLVTYALSAVARLEHWRSRPVPIAPAKKRRAARRDGHKGRATSLSQSRTGRPLLQRGWGTSDKSVDWAGSIGNPDGVVILGNLPL